MNGKCGVAIDFHNEGDRMAWRYLYTVQLDSGGAFKVKKDKVCAEGAGGLTKKKERDAGKGKKGKKGKKGRGGRS